MPKNRGFVAKERKKSGQPRGNGKPSSTATNGVSQPTVPHVSPYPTPAAMEEVVYPPRVTRPGHNPLRPGGFPGRVFDFLSSLKLAVVLLSIMGTVCVAGTIYESSYTARLAQRLIYRTLWFDFLIAAIFINVVFATLSRFPWRMTQVGFLITHLGVLTTLVGALISHRYGVEGNMMLNEGQSKNSIQLGSSFIGIQEAGAQVRHRFDTTEVEWGHPSREKPQTYAFKELGLKAIVDGFYPDSEWNEVWKEGGPAKNPALHFTIDNTTMGRMAEGWLAPLMPSHQSSNLGPARIVARWVEDESTLQEQLSPPVASATSELGMLEVKVKATGKTCKIDVAQALKAPVQIPDTSYSVQVTEHLNAGYLNEAGVLAETPDRSPNPLVIYDLYQGSARILERQIEYANFPDFGSMHGETQVAPPVESTYLTAQAGPSKGAEFALLMGPGDQLHWKVVTSTGQTSSGPLEIGKPVPMPMMTAGMQLAVDTVLTNALRDEVLLKKEIKKGDFGNKAAHVVLTDEKGNDAEFWQEAFNSSEVNLGGRKFVVTYQNDEQPLGFSLHLQDFRLRHYPGAENRPMSFESDVRVTGPTSQESRDKVTIMMNEPLDHNGYRVFQSSYIDQPKGDPRISIFSIAHDPGISVIYSGSIILCLGIAVMFYGKPYLRKIETKWQHQSAKEVPVS